MTQRRERVAILLMLLAVGVAACKSAARKADPAALLREANVLLQHSNDAQWDVEYRKAFTPQNRAQFPANRDSLRAHADSITKSLNENAILSNKAAEKYEQAIAVMKDEKQRKGTALLLSALRTSMKIDDVFKSQMQLVSDERIVDAKTFNEKFLELLKPVAQIQSERDAQLEEGRRLLGM